MSTEAALRTRQGASRSTVGGLKPSISDTAAYIRVLVDCLDETTRAEDRSVYRDHLAEAARLVALLDEDASPERLSDWLDTARRSYGLGFLSGHHGEAAEFAFQALTREFR